AGLHQAQLGLGRSNDLEHQLGTERRSRVADLGADGFVLAVRETGIDASAALYGYLMAAGDQLLDCLGRRGNPRFTSMGFERNTNVHGKISCMIVVINQRTSVAPWGG